MNRRDTLENVIGDYKEVLQQNVGLDQEITSISDRIDRRIEICKNTAQILDESTHEFKRLTSISILR